MNIRDMLNTDPEDDINARLQQVVQDAIAKAEPHYRPSPPMAPSMAHALKEALAEPDPEPGPPPIMSIIRDALLPEHEHWSQPAYDYVVLSDGTMLSRRDLYEQMQREVLEAHPGIRDLLVQRELRHFSIADIDSPY